MTVNSLMKYSLAAVGGATAITLLFYFADQGVLAMAAKYASDRPTLMKFMSDMGYPKIGEWCGEFAASIIRRAGGTPPSGAAIASNWRTYGTPDAMPHVGDVAVADRGVPTGAIGSHVGFVTSVDPQNDTFTLESGNSTNIYTTRKIRCFSFHTPPDNVLSALIGNGVPSGTAIATAPADLPLNRARIALYPFVSAISSPNPDDCSQDSLDTAHYDKIQNDDSLQQPPTRCDLTTKGEHCLGNNRGGNRAWIQDLPVSDADFFATLCACPHACMTRESTMYGPYRRCAAAITKSKQCLVWMVRASACFI